MADRRMFAKSIIDSDAFLDMPLSTQALYFHLSMRADDDGFINNPKKIQRMINASDDDLKLLVVKRFIIPFESGIVVIKHWKIHNYIQKDRYKETVYQEERSMLDVKPNNSYTLISENMPSRIHGVSTLDTDCIHPASSSYTDCIHPVSALDTQVRLGKDRVVEDSVDECMGVAEAPKNKKNTCFTPPTVAEVATYCKERNNRVDAQRFVDFYTSKGWMVGKTKMRDWKSAVRTWERNESNNSSRTYSGRPQICQSEENDDILDGIF